MHSGNRFRLIKADRLALIFIAITLILTALFWAMVVVAAGVGGANHVLASTGISWVEDALIGIVSFWCALRAIDFVRGGPTRTLFAKSPQASAAPLSAGKDLAAHHP